MLNVIYQAYLRWRDRDRLRISIQTLDPENENGTAPFEIVVTNEGKTPVTIISTGLLIDKREKLYVELKPPREYEHPKAITRPPRLPLRRRGLKRTLIGRWVLVMPMTARQLDSGAVFTFGAKMDRFPGALKHADIPIRPGVFLPHDERRFGKGSRIFRAALNRGWRPSPESGPDPAPEQYFLFRQRFRRRMNPGMLHLDSD